MKTSPLFKVSEAFICFEGVRDANLTLLNFRLLLLLWATPCGSRVGFSQRARKLAAGMELGSCTRSVCMTLGSSLGPAFSFLLMGWW